MADTTGAVSKSGTSSRTSASGVSFLSGENPGQAWKTVIDFVKDEDTKQRLKDNAHTKELKASVDLMAQARDEQLKAKGAGVEAGMAAVTKIADGVKVIEAQYGGNPTDPTSLIARNNKALTDLNERLLAKQSRANELRDASGILSGFGRNVILPEVNQEVAILDGQRQAFVQANVQLHEGIKNASSQVEKITTFTDLDSKRAALQQEQAALAEQMGRNEFTTIGQQMATDWAVSDQSLKYKQALAEAATKNVRQRFETAIQQHTLDGFMQDETLARKVEDVMKWPRGKFNEYRTFYASQPQTWEAIGRFALFGEALLPTDKELVYNNINKAGHVNPDGSKSEVLLDLEESMRLRPQANAYVAKFKQWAANEAAKKQGGLVSAMELEKILAEPNRYMSQYAEFKKSPEAQDWFTPSDSVKINPAALIPRLDNADKIVGQFPMVIEAVKHLPPESQRQDLLPVDLINIVRHQFPKESESKLAAQVSAYYQHVEKFDSQRPVYVGMGLPKPDARSYKVAVPVAGFFERAAAVTPGLAWTREAGQLTTDMPAATGSMDIRSQAQVTSYIRSLNQKDKLNSTK